MNGCVQLTITMTTALSLTDQPLAGHFVATWLTNSFVSSASLAQSSGHPHLWCAPSDASDAASGMHSSGSEGRDTLAKLNVALWSFFIENNYRVEWETRGGQRAFVLASCGARSGTWKELARIDMLRSTIDDDETNACWEDLFLNVPAFAKLASDSDLGSRKRRGNVVEACVGASFLAAHELAAASASFCFKKEPPEALAHIDATFPLIRASRRGVASIDTS